MFPISTRPLELTSNVPIRGLSRQLVAANPTPLRWQLCIETDKIFCNGQNRTKIGNGYDAYNDLPYALYEELYDFGSFGSPNGSTPIDAGSFASPSVNFYLDFCIFNLT